MQKTTLELQDYLSVNLDKYTKIEYDSLFKLSRKDVMPYEKSDNTWVSVTIERDLDLWHYERSVYTMLDLLSDVGGFHGMLILILALVASAWSYNSLDNFMVSRLFKIKKP